MQLINPNNGKIGNFVFILPVNVCSNSFTYFPCKCKIINDKCTRANITKNNQLANTADYSTSFNNNANRERKVTAKIAITGVFVTLFTYLNIDS